MGERMPATSLVRVEPYDPDWPRRFDQEATRIKDALGDLALRIDHIGSTAVTGLPAKPIVDIAVAVARLDPEQPYREPLQRIGYDYGGQLEAFFAERRYFKLNRDGTA
jgi:GrpB-like predicted nucleotidyltransferase (UPF0157 family)